MRICQPQIPQTGGRLSFITKPGCCSAGRPLAHRPCRILWPHTAPKKRCTAWIRALRQLAAVDCLPTLQSPTTRPNLHGESFSSMGNSSSRHHKPHSGQAPSDAGNHFVSRRSTSPLGLADRQEYIIYVNDKPFELPEFEAEFNLAFSEVLSRRRGPDTDFQRTKITLSGSRRSSCPPAVAQQYAGNPQKDMLLRATYQGKADSLSASLTAVKINKAVHDACKQLHMFVWVP